MVQGHIKGGSFENAVCRVFSTWLVPGDWSKKAAKVHELPFRRRFTSVTPLDGSWDGKGDILHKPDVPFPFCVECKKIEGWDLDGVFNEKWPPWGWWDQAIDQASKTVRLLPLLVFSRNRHKIYVVMDEEVAAWLPLKPKHGPVLSVERENGDRLTLALMDDLVCVPASKLRSARFLKMHWRHGGKPAAS